MNNAAENRRKKALLIVNPCAGKNRTRSDLGEIVNAFPDGVFDFTIKYTTCQGDAVNIARDFAEGHDLVICCGGDGTLNETINGLMSAGANIPIGYLPMGSTNDLAVTLGIPTKLNEVAELIARGLDNKEISPPGTQTDTMSATTTDISFHMSPASAPAQRYHTAPRRR